MQEILGNLGGKTRIVKMLSKKEQIDEARRFFSKCWFDDEKCREGLNSLRRYRYLYNEQTKTFSRDPVHDNASHAADSWQYMSVGFEEKKSIRSEQQEQQLRERIRNRKFAATIY